MQARVDFPKSCSDLHMSAKAHPCLHSITVPSHACKITERFDPTYSFYKKRLLIPIWRKSLFVSFLYPVSILKQLRVYRILHLPHVTPIVLYEYHTHLDLCRQDSWPQLSYSFHLSLVHRARPSTQRTISIFPLTKTFPKWGNWTEPEVLKKALHSYEAVLK